MTRSRAFGKKEVRNQFSLYVRNPKDNRGSERVEKNKLINKQRTEGSLSVKSSAFQVESKEEKVEK